MNSLQILYIIRLIFTGFIIYHFKRSKRYSIKNHYISILQKILPLYKYAEKTKNPIEFKFADILSQLKNFDKIAVIASGNSLNKLKELDNRCLYITTNNSVYKAFGYNFLYFSFSFEYINMYLREGFNKSDGCIGTIFHFSKSKMNIKKRNRAYNLIKNYISTYSRNYPEILISDNINDSIEFENHTIIDSFIKDTFQVDFSELNSGISILLLGYYFAKKLNKEINIYGLDAGEGGQSYYTKTGVPGKDVSDDITKEFLNRILNTIYSNNELVIRNYSYFKPYNE